MHWKRRSSAFVALTGRVLWALGMEERTSALWVEKSGSGMDCGKEALEPVVEEEGPAGTVAYVLMWRWYVIAWCVDALPVKAAERRIKSMMSLAGVSSDGMARNLKSNYVFKPTAGSALRFDRGRTSRGGLTRR